MELIIEFIKSHPREIIANIIACIAAVGSFASYQVNSQKKVLVLQIFANCVTAISFLVLGAWTGLAMNVIAITRNIVYYYKDKKAFSGKYIPFVFAGVMILWGIFTWTEWYCVLAVTGWVVNTLALALPSAQKIRKSILISSPLMGLYCLLTANIFSAIKEMISVVSAIIGLARYSGTK
ncbi:MAG: YgjV family protein [Ruminococcaceae bacterium]|nr:YgjV family protein [Oscillospiraceae bacterium]